MRQLQKKSPCMEEGQVLYGVPTVVLTNAVRRRAGKVVVLRGDWTTEHPLSAQAAVFVSANRAGIFSAADPAPTNFLHVYGLLCETFIHAFSHKQTSRSENTVACCFCLRLLLTQPTAAAETAFGLRV